MSKRKAKLPEDATDEEYDKEKEIKYKLPENKLGLPEDPTDEESLKEIKYKNRRNKLGLENASDYFENRRKRKKKLKIVKMSID